jgi:IS605 OrfB family transposase
MTLVADIQLKPSAEQAKALKATLERCKLKRATLHKHGTKSATRRLNGKQTRFGKHTNHCISREIVATAERSHCAIVLGDLTHIRKRVKARKAQRSRLAGWSFAQLRAFTTDKAVREAIPVVANNPRDTSRTAPPCGVIDERNRKSQSEFSCVRCCDAAAADFVGALNIGHQGPNSYVAKARRGLRSLSGKRHAVALRRAEIHLLNGRIGGDLGRRSLGDDQPAGRL